MTDPAVAMTDPAVAWDYGHSAGTILCHITRKDQTLGNRLLNGWSVHHNQPQVFRRMLDETLAESNYRGAGQLLATSGLPRQLPRQHVGAAIDGYQAGWTAAEKSANNTTP